MCHSKGLCNTYKMKKKTPTLLQIISDKEALNNAWNKLEKYNKDSHGLSGETIESFGQNLNDKISSISEKLKQGKYKFRPTRGVLIAKKGKNKFRPLQIPEISDRVVIKAIAILLDIIFSETLNKSNGYSFAYQKSIGVKDALMKIREHYNNGNKFALEADLVNFFGTVNKKELLENQIFPFLADTSINDLILDSLNQRVGNMTDFDEVRIKFFDNVHKGIPQGNALSPLLSNIYLSEFDQKLIKDKLCLVRYADDFVILARTEEECDLAYWKSKKYLMELKLEVHPLGQSDKTKITDINKDTLTFLSVTFDGNYLYPSLENVENFVEKIWELLKGNVDFNLLEFVTKIKNKHEGWISAFIYTDIKRYSEKLDYTINRVLYMKLEKIDWKLKEQKLGKLPKEFRSKQSSAFCISKIQRLHCGIPFTNHLVDNKLKKIEDDLAREFAKLKT